MKNIIKTLSGVFIVSHLLLSGCGSNSDDPVPEVDCDQSDLEVNVDGTQAVSGCGTNDGSLSVSAQGGQGQTLYSIDGVDFQESGSFTGLSAGNYTVTAQDENECQATVSATVGVEDSNLAITGITASNAGCETSYGDITVDATGEGTLMYKINDGAFQASNVFTGLASANYEVAVKDASGCEITAERQILNGTSYEQQVKNIITTNCAVSGCHNGANGESQNWTVFSNVQAKASNIKSSTQSGTMPPPGSGHSITQTEKDLIACWVDDGALDN